MDDNERHAQIKKMFGEGAANYASAYHSQMGHFPTNEVLTEKGFKGRSSAQELVRTEACKRAKTLVSVLFNEMEIAKRRFERAKATLAYLEGDGEALACPLPYADFSNRLSVETAKLEALIMLEAGMEESSK